MKLLMMRRLMFVLLLLFAVGSLAQPSPKPTPRAALEFPLELNQKIVAGQSAVGSKVEGKLIIATLVHGAVIPEGAVFTGTVEESVARNGANPSRLRVHLTSSKWHGGSSAVDIYLTNVVYPRRKSQQNDDPDDPMASAARRRERILAAERNGGMPPLPDTESPVTAKRYDRRTTLEDVKLERGENGVIAITSEKFNVRLDGGVVCSFEGTAGK